MNRSAPLDMEALGIMHVRMREPGSTSRQDTHLIVADVILDQATIFVVLKEHDGPWPMTIENNSIFEIAFGQIVSFVLQFQHLDIDNVP